MLRTIASCGYIRSTTAMDVSRGSWPTPCFCVVGQAAVSGRLPGACAQFDRIQGQARKRGRAQPRRLQGIHLATRATRSRVATIPPALSENVKFTFLLNRIFGAMPLEKQLVRTWITESMLCSAPVETGIVPFKVTRECGERYLAKQLVLLNRCPIVALGGKAQQRVKYLKSVDPALSERVIGAYAAAPPGCNHKPARPSWEDAARKVRDRLDNAA